MQTGAPATGRTIAQKPVLVGLALVTLTVLAHVVVLATPGFYSHDEWQKFDHVQARGFGDFARAYTTVQVGPEFGYPVRPIGFLQQAFASLWMQTSPWIAHLFGIANHALVTLAFVWVLRRAGVVAGTAALAGALFVISPLATTAVAWVAASFDQLYVLFLLLAAAAAVGTPRQGHGFARAATIVLATVAALLSKETAIAAPAMIALLAYVEWQRDPQRFALRPYVVCVALVSVLVASYLAYRSAAIAASLAGGGVGEYTPSLAHVPSNAWKYFTFPFRLKLVETSDAVFRSPWQPAAAALAHLMLIGAVARLFGSRMALAYVAGYFVFLVPVLTLPNPGLQCLYASGLAMSLALACVLARLWTTRRLPALALFVLGAFALLTHTLYIEVSFYETGVCQSRFLAALDNTLAQAGEAGPPLEIVARGPGARVAARAIAFRERYRTDAGNPRVLLLQLPAGAETPAAASRVRLTDACTLSAAGS